MWKQLKYVQDENSNKLGNQLQNVSKRFTKNFQEVNHHNNLRLILY